MILTMSCGREEGTLLRKGGRGRKREGREEKRKGRRE
jgi:hypothetical protein